MFFNLKQRDIVLRPLKWKQFFYHAAVDDLNSQSLMIECEWQRHWLSDKINVGILQENLEEIPITLTLILADENHPAFKAQENEEVLVGRFIYYAPIRTDDGLVNDKTGEVDGSLLIGKDNYKDICTQLSKISPDALIGLTLQFENEEHEWDGTKPLGITSGKLVFFNNAPFAKNDDCSPELIAPPKVKDEALLENLYNSVITLNSYLKLIFGVLVLTLISTWIRGK